MLVLRRNRAICRTLYAKYRSWRKETRKLLIELEKEGIRLQAQAQRRWLANEARQGKAMEREPKNDQAGEDLLG